MVIDTEDLLRAEDERPNQQVRVIDHAGASPDHDRAWTRRIRSRYVDPT